jgi:hypothetical protein
MKTTKKDKRWINLMDEYKREVDVIETKYKTKQQVLLEKQKTNK